MAEIRPIRNEQDYEAALQQLDSVFDALPGTPEGDRLEVLSTLIEAYEQERHPIPPADPIEAIAFYMEQNNLTATDLGNLLGSKPHASEVLNRKRNLSLAMIRRLVDEWGIPADILIREPRANKSPRGHHSRARH